MNRVFLLSLVSTVLIIGLGVALIAPAFLTSRGETTKQRIMLSFSVNDDSGDAIDWCQRLATTLGESDVRATVFITGQAADRDPNCVRILAANKQVDIGSQTYSYVSLPSIDDYTQKLDEVSLGKQAVDRAGNITSQSFRAPYGATDEDIFSLLSRSDIVADFSYEDHYNKYYQGQYIWFNVTSVEGKDSRAFLNDMQVTNVPVVINFESDESDIAEIRDFLAELEKTPFSTRIQLVNASDLVENTLTKRENDRA